MICGFSMLFISKRLNIIKSKTSLKILTFLLFLPMLNVLNCFLRCIHLDRPGKFNDSTFLDYLLTQFMAEAATFFIQSYT